MNTKSSLSLTSAVLVLGLSVTATACAVEPIDGEHEGVATSAQVKQTGPTEGGACHVISGANKGKSGTYNADGDCEGSWGISECTNQDGTDSGRCAAGKAAVVRPPIFGTSGGLTKAVLTP